MVSFSLSLLLFHIPVMLAELSLEKVELQSNLGKLRGLRHRLKGDDGQEIALFFGVPYAQPPVGPLRFERPRPPPKWSGIRSAERPAAACIYHAWPEGLGKGKKNYSEDCLYLNIFTPFPLPGQAHLLPVLLIIHGGGFEVGSSHDYIDYEDVGNKFVAQGIVVVSLDYRLGWIGFGSTGDEEMPGNLGLFDQLAALQFLHANIRAFGGDPGRITVYGYSAGSASASLLAISPLSRDLFSQSIQMSGSPFCAWALNERTVNETRLLARALACPGGQSVKHCLGQKTVAQIWSAVDRIGPTRYSDVNFSKWSPRVDGHFLPVDVAELIRSAPPKPTLIGFVELESLSWTLFTGANNSLAAFAIPWEQLGEYGQRRFEQSIRDLVAKPEFFGDLAEEAGREIVGHYLADDLLAELGELQGWNSPNYFLQRYTQVLSDLNFIVPVLMEMRLKAQLGWPLHFYQNVHYNPKEFPALVKVHQNFHTNDENFLFRESHFPFNFDLTEEDRLVEAHLVHIMANFIKSGNPSPASVHWAMASREQPTRHLRIMARPRLEHNLEEDTRGRFQFWQRFVHKYGHIWDPVRGARGHKGLDLDGEEGKKHSRGI